MFASVSDGPELEPSVTWPQLTDRRRWRRLGAFRRTRVVFSG